MNYIPDTGEYSTNIYVNNKQPQLCSDEKIENLHSSFQCNLYCQGSLCNIQNFITVHENSFVTPPGKYSNWQECVQNSDCASQKCSCTPIAQRDKGRCMTSVRDPIFSTLYQTVCLRNLTEIKTNLEIRKEICSYYLLTEMGHLLTQLFINENNKQITCLQQFSDYPKLMEVRQIGEKFTSIMIWFLVVLLSAGLCILTKKFCIEEKKENYQVLVDRQI